MPDVRKQPAIAWLVLLLLAVVNYGNFYVYDSIGPVADLLQRERGFSDTQIGLLNAIYSLPNVLLILVGGVLVDRFGAGPMMLVTGGIMLLGALLTASGADFTWMATGRLLFGIGAETNNIATLAAVARHFAGTNVAFAMGMSVLTLALFRRFRARHVDNALLILGAGLAGSILFLVAGVMGMVNVDQAVQLAAGQELP